MCAKGPNPPAQVVNISSLYNCCRPSSGFYIPFLDNSTYLLLWQYKSFFFLGLFQVFFIFSIRFSFFSTENLGYSWKFYFFNLVKIWLFFLIFQGKNLPIFYITKLKRKTLIAGVQEFTRVWARPISQPLGSSFSTLFQIQEPSGSIQKPRLVAHYCWPVLVLGNFYFYFYFWHKWKEFIAKRNKNRRSATAHTEP
jgi:hypothetical protein